MAPIIDPNECNGCGTCIEVCPSDVLQPREGETIPIVQYPYECWHCAACVMECPIPGAIRLRLPLPQMVLYR